MARAEGTAGLIRFSGRAPAPREGAACDHAKRRSARPAAGRKPLAGLHIGCSEGPSHADALYAFRRARTRLADGVANHRCSPRAEDFKGTKRALHRPGLCLGDQRRPKRFTPEPYSSQRRCRCSRMPQALDTQWRSSGAATRDRVGRAACRRSTPPADGRHYMKSDAQAVREKFKSSYLKKKIRRYREASISDAHHLQMGLARVLPDRADSSMGARTAVPLGRGVAREPELLVDYAPVSPTRPLRYDLCSRPPIPSACRCGLSTSILQNGRDRVIDSCAARMAPQRSQIQPRHHAARAVVRDVGRVLEMVKLATAREVSGAPGEPSPGMARQMEPCCEAREKKTSQGSSLWGKAGGLVRNALNAEGMIAPGRLTVTAASRQGRRT